MKGKVKWFNKTKGFGFVAGEDGSEYFIHQTQLPKDLILNEGDSVVFDTTETDKGKQALQLELDPHN